MEKLQFFLKNRHILTICFWFCFYTKPALFCLTPSSLFLSAQNSKQRKSLNRRIIIIHNPIKKSELIPLPPLKSSDDPFDPLHIRLVEMFRFVFKNWKKYSLIWQEKLYKRSKLAKYKLCTAVRIWPMVWKTSWLFLLLKCRCQNIFPYLFAKSEVHKELEASLSGSLHFPSSVGQKKWNFYFLKANPSQIHS